MRAAPRRRAGNARRPKARHDRPQRCLHTCLEITDLYKIRVTRVKSGMRGPRAGSPPLALQTLLQEPDETRRHEAGIAPVLVDRIAEPKMRRPLHDAGTNEKVGLLQS